MKTLNKNTKTTLIALLIISLIASPLLMMPNVYAHTPAWTIPTYAYVTASPSTVGVGQSTLFVLWLDKFPPTAGGLGGDRWRGWKVDITQPDGTNITMSVTGETSQVGSAFLSFTPTQVGDHRIIFSWPGQTLTNGTGSPNLAGVAYVGDFFQGATSDPFTLHVQTDPIEEWQESPLPADYWTRPINAMNRDWAVIASNWPKGSWFRYSNFQEYGQAPNSPHVMWAQPLSFGGITDANYEDMSYGTMDYEFPWSWTTPIILNGVVYLNTPMYPKYGYSAIDLQTGKLLWSKNGTDNGLNNPVVTVYYQGLGGAGVYSGQTFPLLSNGQLYNWAGVNGEGTVAYLWMAQSGTPQTATSGGTMWHMLDANTGNWILSLKNVPGGTSVTDQDGSLLLYSYSASTGRFLAWNSSQSIGPPSPTGTGQQQWKPRTGAVLDAVNDTTWTQWGPVTNSTLGQILPDDIYPRSGYTMNVTGPTGLPGLSRVVQDAGRVPKMMLFTDFTNLPSFGSSDLNFRVSAVRIDEHVAPYSPQPDKTGTQNNNLGYGVTLLYDKTLAKPLGGNLTFSLGPISYEENIFTVWSKETRQWWGYSLTDGSLVWGPTAPQSSWDMYGNGGAYAYGMLLSGTYGGVLNAYDIKTGIMLWNYTLSGIGHESPYGNYQLTISGIADGKIYATSGEHSPTKPLWRGSYMRCINATTGEEIWKLSDFNMGIAIADGYLITGSMYDTQLYCIGKGPSAITVQAPMTGITAGNKAIIKGTITDVSPGATKISEQKGFSVAAIADADQQAYMEYLYEQQAMPSNAKGVPVTLSAVDPNGNLIPIGTTTSDNTGTFGYAWEAPDVAGTYQIIASFEGSESYYRSNAITYAIVTEAASTPAPTATPVSMTDTYVLGVGAAAIIAIVIGLIIILMLRKRP